MLIYNVMPSIINQFLPIMNYELGPVFLIYMTLTIKNVFF